MLASLNRRSENVVVKAIIVPELELRNVKMQVFLADVVECADDAALEDAPKTLTRLSANGTDDILMLGLTGKFLSVSHLVLSCLAVSCFARELRCLATQIVMLKRERIAAFGGVKVLPGMPA